MKKENAEELNTEMLYIDRDCLLDYKFSITDVINERLGWDKEILLVIQGLTRLAPEVEVKYDSFVKEVLAEMIESIKLSKYGEQRVEFTYDEEKELIFVTGDVTEYIDELDWNDIPFITDARSVVNRFIESNSRIWIIIDEEV